jgi:hypothetical protein
MRCIFDREGTKFRQIGCGCQLQDPYLALLASLVALGFAAQVWSSIKEKSRYGA